MEKEDIKEIFEHSPCGNEKIELPKDIQKRMLEFFMRTSIPRIKANKNNTLSDDRKTGD